MGGRGPNTQHRDWTVTNTSSLLLLQISPTLTLNCPIRHPLRPPHDLQRLPGRIHHRKPSSVPTSPSFPRETPPVFSAWLEALVLLHPGASSPWRWDCHLISSLVHCPCCPLGTACPCPSSACLRDLPKSCPNFVPGRGDDQTGTLRVTRPWMMLGALVSEHRSGRGTSGFPGVSAVRIPLAELHQLSLCPGCLCCLNPPGRAAPALPVPRLSWQRCSHRRLLDQLSFPADLLEAVEGDGCHGSHTSPSARGARKDRYVCERQWGGAGGDGELLRHRVGVTGLVTPCAVPGMSLSG